MKSSDFEDYLSLIRLGIGHKTALPSREIKWQLIQDLAEKQGLLGVILDGMEEVRKIDSSLSMPERPMLKQLIGEVLTEYEDRYKLYGRVIAAMAGFYAHHSIKMMVLKGYACSLNWPRPEHRPSGDIDIWQFGKQKEGDRLVAREKGIKVDNSHHHHSVFNWNIFSVENHYDFVNVYTRRSNAEMEKVFKELGRDDSHYVELHGSKVYLPSPNLHALFLIKHAVSHFAATNLNLRQVLDWAFFVEKHTAEIDWEWLDEMLEKYQMKEFFDCLNAICLEDLGFETSSFKGGQFDPVLKEKILADIIDPAFDDEDYKHLIPRVLYKFKRWHANAWKRKLCYKESDWSMFWGSVWAHIVKPRSI